MNKPSLTLVGTGSYLSEILTNFYLTSPTISKATYIYCSGLLVSTTVEIIAM
jgi:hypothetical protein